MIPWLMPSRNWNGGDTDRRKTKMTPTLFFSNLYCEHDC